MKNIFRTFEIIAIIAIIGFSFVTCGGDDGGGNEDEDEEPVLTMTFTEDPYWNETGHDERYRWLYRYKDASNPFDLSSMYANNKAYSFTYSFISNIDIDEFAINFQDKDGKGISDWTWLKGDIKKNTKYSGSAFIPPNSDAVGTSSADNFLVFYVKNRDVTTPATMTFYNFSLELVDNENGSGGGGQNDPGDLAGTWTGKIGSYDATITVSGSGWTMTASGTSFYDSGYFVRNGNTATLYLSSGTNNGTATLINSTTIQVVLNSNTIFPGTYTLTKQGGSSGGDNGGLSSGCFEPIGSPPTAYQIITVGPIPNQVVIPATYNGLPVTTITSSAFAYITNLTSITIPNSITSIGSFAFSGCTSLTSVTFQGTISSDSFNKFAFDGDLYDKYLAGGTGTYTTTGKVGSSSKWQKQ